MGAGDRGRDPGDRRDGTTAVANDDPAQAALFEVLGDETRVAIVRALADVRRDSWQWVGLTFAELRRAVGPIDTGRFNYHLDKLRGTLVVKDGDEYKLRNEGLRLAGAMAAGTYTAGTVSKRTTVPHPCPREGCDRDLVVDYEHQHFRTLCPDHGTFASTTLPPIVVENADAEDLLAIAKSDTATRIRRAREGVCPHCWGPMSATLPATDATVPTVAGEVPPDAVIVVFECDHCGMTFPTSPGVCVQDHPAVVSLFHEHGQDIRSRPFATIEFADATLPVVESEKPVRVRVPVTCEGDHLDVWLDGDATVVDHERVDGADAAPDDS